MSIIDKMHEHAQDVTVHLTDEMDDNQKIKDMWLWAADLSTNFMIPRDIALRIAMHQERINAAERIEGALILIASKLKGLT